MTGQGPGWRVVAPVAAALRLALAAFAVVGTASTAALLWLRARATSAPAEAALSAGDPLAGPQRLVRGVWAVEVVVALAILVLVVVWMRRVAANHVALARPRTRFATPGWAVGCWLLWFVLPVLVMRELWKGSDPSVPEGSPAWKQSRGNPLVPVWFATFVLGGLVTNLTNGALDAASTVGATRLAELAGWRAAATAVLVVSALVLRQVVGALTLRQLQAIEGAAR